MSKITIVQILRSPEGGIRKHVVDILENLPSSAYEKIFVTDMCSSDRDLTYLADNYDVIIKSISIPDQPGFKDLFNIIKIIFFLWGRKGMILHGHGAKGGLYARVCSTFLRCKSVYTPHGGSLHRVFGKLKAFVFDTVEKFLIPLTDRFIFESNYSAQEFEKYVGDCSSKRIVNYNGVSFSRPCKNTQYTPGEKLQLASFGLLRKLKGHDIVIEALAMLKDLGIDFTYTIYGYGEELYSIKEQVSRLGLAGRVSTTGFTDNILEEMKNYDLVIHPSRFESFGYVPLEAMSIKVPVITSFEGGLKEIYIEDGTLVAKNNTAKEYAGLLEEVFNGALDLELRTERAYQASKEKFSVDVMIKCLDETYLVLVTSF